MTAQLSEMPWLPDTALDWIDQCKNIKPDRVHGPVGFELQRLALFKLDGLHSRQLKRTAKKLRAAGYDMSPLSPFKLGIVASNTFDLVQDYLEAAAIRHGVLLDVIPSPYGQIMQSILNPDSFVYKNKMDAILVAWDHRYLELDKQSTLEEDALNNSLKITEDLLLALKDYGGPPAILPTLPISSSTLYGSLDVILNGTLRNRVEKYNAALITLVEKYGAYVLDVSGLASQIGVAEWFNQVQWVAYKLPFDTRFAPIYADYLARILGAIRGKSAKCLVLDLDNTLWGGVIGDDGIDGIVLGQGSPLGESFVLVQKAALRLRSRGIFLAIASKNEHAIALSPFLNHPEMMIKEDDISVFVANWIDKASNIEAIANTLNIGLDSIVFLDDNPAERKQVRDALPTVRVLELPEDPTYFSWLLESCGFFEAVTISEEDATRVEMFAQNIKRDQIKLKARDLSDYLQSLDMRLIANPFDTTGRKRIVQLINKTNQFNLTTKRYTESEVKCLEEAENIFTLQLRLTDRFGDLGMISVVVCRPCPQMNDHWEIDTWLMSCRVLGRNVEAAVLSIIVKHAQSRGIKTLRGVYRPTLKNIMVSNHYPNLGFKKVDQIEDAIIWQLDLEQYSTACTYVQIEDCIDLKGLLN